MSLLKTLFGWSGGKEISRGCILVTAFLGAAPIQPQSWPRGVLYLLVWELLPLLLAPDRSSASFCSRVPVRWACRRRVYSLIGLNNRFLTVWEAGDVQGQVQAWSGAVMLGSGEAVRLPPLQRRMPLPGFTVFEWPPALCAGVGARELCDVSSHKNTDPVELGSHHCDLIQL